MKTLNIKPGFTFILEDTTYVVDYFKYISKNQNGDKVRYYKCFEKNNTSSTRCVQKDDILNGLMYYNKTK